MAGLATVSGVKRLRLSKMQKKSGKAVGKRPAGLLKPKKARKKPIRKKKTTNRGRY